MKFKEGFRCQTKFTIKDIEKKGIAVNGRRLGVGLGRDGVSLLSGTSHYSGIYSISLLLRLSMILGTERRSFLSCPLWVERYNYKLLAHISLIIPESALKADNYYMSWWRFCVSISTLCIDSSLLQNLRHDGYTLCVAQLLLSIILLILLELILFSNCLLICLFVFTRH